MAYVKVPQLRSHYEIMERLNCCIKCCCTGLSCSPLHITANRGRIRITWKIFHKLLPSTDKQHGRRLQSFWHRDYSRKIGTSSRKNTWVLLVLFYQQNKSILNTISQNSFKTLTATCISKFGPNHHVCILVHNQWHIFYCVYTTNSCTHYKRFLWDTDG